MTTPRDTGLGKGRPPGMPNRGTTGGAGQAREAAPRPPRINPGPPYVEVEPYGRWSWYGRVIHGIGRVDSFHAVGTRAHADRVAARRLAKYLREEQRLAERQHRVGLP